MKEIPVLLQIPVLVIMALAVLVSTLAQLLVVNKHVMFDREGSLKLLD